MSSLGMLPVSIKMYGQTLPLKSLGKIQKARMNANEWHFFPFDAGISNEIRLSLQNNQRVRASYDEGKLRISTEPRNISWKLDRSRTRQSYGWDETNPAGKVKGNPKSRPKQNKRLQQIQLMSDESSCEVW
eukprot:CAMPEP_0185774448 /NCGR_PEP_ID=MMETSP1174-20130828/78210_1 /TAXON_ID=35687 /ORGANISM="Dictyocha speculum, Strain CCMP1381" /LENGTH=130 /DNA_ID=CAMNT_0028461607 /DNA_START=69 /DNA_END=458 /DNA_ORIENTATION=+